MRLQCDEPAAASAAPTQIQIVLETFCRTSMHFELTRQENQKVPYPSERCNRAIGRKSHNRFPQFIRQPIHMLRKFATQKRAGNANRTCGAKGPCGRHFKSEPAGRRDRLTSVTDRRQTMTNFSLRESGANSALTAGCTCRLFVQCSPYISNSRMH